jgi:hypothetical protein
MDGVIDPRRAVRERRPQGIMRPGGDNQRPPAISDGPATVERPETEPILGQSELDPYVRALRVRPMIGRGARTGRVKVVHRTGVRGDELCHAFTLTRAGMATLQSERILDSAEATYPDGSAVVPPGDDPLRYSVHCGSCGTHAVECLEIEFYEC